MCDKHHTSVFPLAEYAGSSELQHCMKTSTPRPKYVLAVERHRMKGWWVDEWKEGDKKYE